MAKDSKQVKVVKKGGFGSFLFGFLFGIIVVIGAVVGVGFYAYKNLTLSTVEGTIGTNIPVNEEVKNKSLESLIKLTVDLVTDQNTLTLEKIENSFGIVECVTGNTIPVAIKKDGNKLTYIYSSSEITSDCLDISHLKTTKISELGNEISTFINKLSLEDLQKVADFELPDIPLINDVKTQPLMQALNEISSKLDLANLTLSDLNTHFGIDLSSVNALKDFMDIPLNGAGNENLAYALTNATIGNFVGLSKQANETEEQYAERLDDAGILGLLANTKLNELQSKLNSLTIGEITKVKDSDKSILVALKNSTLQTLNEDIKALDIPNKSLSQLENWGLVDLTDLWNDTSLTDTKKEEIANATLSDIIDAYINSQKLMG